MATNNISKMNNPLHLVTNFLKSGNLRSQKIKVNILLSLGIKGISVITSFLMVPLTLNYLGTVDFGVWLTLSSIIAWFGFFDIGLGNGLRNKFAEALALGDQPLARSYVSTTYVALALIMVGMWLIFFPINFFIDWNTFLNIPANADYDFSKIAMFVFTLFLLRFVLKLISIIITADQRPALSNTFDPISNVISLIAIYLLTLTTNGSLVNFAIVVTTSPLIVFLVATIYFFNREYKEFSPSLKYVDFKHFKVLGGVGLQFFLVQIAVIVIFMTDNLIIARVLGPKEVTIYNIAYKYFNIITMMFTIIISPLWSAYTQAYTVGDIPWIKNVNNKMVKIWMIIVLTVFIMIFISNWFYGIWVGKGINIPVLLTIIMGIFIVISTWNNVYVYFINGTGKIRLQVYSSALAAIINIPLSIFFARELGLGSAGVILATCICLSPGSILGPMQYHKILNKKDIGIWGK